QALPSDSQGGRGQQGELSPDDAALGFSIVSSQINLRVVGIVDAQTVATGANPFGRSGAYLPLAIAEKLAIVQGNDMAEIVRDAPVARGQRYATLTMRVQRAADVPATEDAVKQLGYSAFSLLDATRNLSRVFAILDMLLGIFGSLALTVACLGII